MNRDEKSLKIRFFVVDKKEVSLVEMPLFAKYRFTMLKATTFRFYLDTSAAIYEII